MIWLSPDWMFLLSRRIRRRWKAALRRLNLFSHWTLLTYLTLKRIKTAPDTSIPTGGIDKQWAGPAPWASTSDVRRG